MQVAALKPWLNAALAFIYPEVCQICKANRTKLAEGLVCSSCWQKVRFIRAPFCDRCGLPFQGAITNKFECSNCKDVDLSFSSARSAVVANDAVMDVIRRYKYRRELWFEPFLADLFLREALPVLRGQKWDCVVPVPLHSVKEREREFNQATRLGRHLAEALNIPLQDRFLKRVIATNTQTRLSREKRAENMRGAFAPQPELALKGQRVIIVDDVFTTGATTNACARVLSKAGAADVCVWTVARGL